MLDDSKKTGEKGFKKSKDFVKLLMEWFNIAQDGSHVSVMTYSDSARVQMKMPKPGTSEPTQTLEELSAKVDGLTYSGGSSSNLEVGLQTAAAQVFPPDDQRRRGDAKKVIVIYCVYFALKSRANINHITLFIGEKLNIYCSR